jgi:CHAT domain-containing protein/BMFP domain-containing protein YqiC
MEDKFRFLIESLNLIEQTQANTEQVYAFWQMNIDLIDTSLIQILSIIPYLLREERVVTSLRFLDFGTLIQQFPLGSQKINIELAITCYQVVITIITSDSYPTQWANIQQVLGLAYMERIEGERKDNIELAIQAYQAALEVYTCHEFPRGWAGTQHLLGLAYMERIKGERKDNIELAIHAYRAASGEKTHNDFPMEWADTQKQLGFAYLERIKGERKDNVKLAILVYQASLEVYTRHDFPVEWAIIQDNLSIAYAYNVQTEKSEFLVESLQLIRDSKVDSGRVYAYWRTNIDKIDASLIQTISNFGSKLVKLNEKEERESIANCFGGFGVLIQEFPFGNRRINLDLAITIHLIYASIFTRQNFPIKWAGTQYNLGIAYSNRIEGDRKENIEQAIQAYQASLEVYTREDFPLNWAMTQNNLGITYRERIEGDRRESIEQAIQACQASLEVYTRETFPTEWARTQMNLGNACREKIEGNRNENIEQAIQAYQMSLEVYTRKAFPMNWADIQNNLGVTYLDRVKGDLRENIEQAIQAYQASLEVYTREAFPTEWARTQNNLGIAYTNRIEGNRNENIEQAIQACQASLEVYTREAFPIDWARTQNNLGATYADRIEGDRRENIEQAIQACQASLEVYTHKAFPIDWAKNQMNLGNAYRERVEGDRKQNIKLAIQAYQASLEVYTREAFPSEWASTQMNLGNTYGKQVEGNRSENIEQAIQACQASLEVYTREAFPIKWAKNQIILSNAYRERIDGNCTENIEQAIQACQASLEVYTCKTSPFEWAMTQNNLGNAYRGRVEGDLRENIEQAIQAYQASLKVYTREDFPLNWAMTQNNLGITYSERIEGDRKQNIGRAIQAFRDALEMGQPESLPLNFLQTGRNLGNLGFIEGNWNIAIEGFNQAITALEKSRSWAMSDRRRQEILNESIGIYEKMLQSCINSDRLDLALKTVERVRSKRLVDLMAAPVSPQNDIPAPVRQILDRIANTQQQMDNLRMGVQSSAPELVGAGTHDRAAEAPPTAEIQALEKQKQDLIDQLGHYDAVSAQLVNINPPDISQIQSELLDRPDVAMLSFYTTTQDTHILIVRSNSIQCFTCAGLGYEQLQRWLYNAWVLPYTQDQTSWQQNMPERLQQLSKKLELDRLVTEHLQDVHELILIPHLLLHLIPFTALPLNGEQNYLGDRFLLRYAPGCQVLKFCTDRTELPLPQQYGTVENATEDLPFAAIEGDAVAKIFNIEDTFRLRGSQQATIDQYKDLLGRVNSVVSSHHAQSRLDNPLESALILANGRRVTLGELLSPAWRFADLNDVFLSCCETGMTMPKTLTDELLTIGTGFLCAGARNVISSLWSVDDMATALLSQYYHQYRAQGHNRIVALQQAQQELRRTSGEQLKAISQDEFIPVLKSQQEKLEEDRKNARRQKQQATPDSEAYQQWDSQQKHYAEQIHCLAEAQINLKKLWTQSLPFDHPVYWAPFTCQGLR